MTRTKWAVLAVTVAVGSMLAFMSGQASRRRHDAIAEAARPSERCPTLAAFGYVHEGMSLADVESTMAMRGTVSETIVGDVRFQTVSFRCDAPMRLVTVQLVNDAVTIKSSYGLR